MYSITSYSYGRPKKTSILLGLFIFCDLGNNFLEHLILESGTDFFSQSLFRTMVTILESDCTNTSALFFVPYCKHRDSKCLSFNQKWGLQ